MSPLRQRLARLTTRVGLLAGTSAAVLAISGIGTGTAVAAPSCPSKTTNIQGKGSSLQRLTQEQWTGREAPSGEPLKAIPHTALSPTVGYNKACSGAPTVSYTSTSSGNGLEAFRYKGAGAIDHLQAFVGTDDAPNSGQIKLAEEATTGGVASGANPIVVPVAQTAIAVVVNPPSGCTFKSGTGITWKDLNKIWGGKTAVKWSDITNTEGTCSSAIIRVVRAEGSGTTFQFKNYLSVLQNEKGAEGPPCIEGVTNWSQLREIGPEEKPNITWPECAGGTEVKRAKGGGGVAELVKNTPGAIGYASLPDAKGKGAATALLQNGEAETVKKYGAPGTTEGTSNVANCGNRIYTVPTTGRRSATAGAGESVDWSAVFGAKPSVGSTFYPLCTLTYDLSWSSYEKAGYSTSATPFKEVTKDYLANYVLGTEGQAQAGSNWYAKLPSAGAAGSAENVLDAAQFAASKIG